MSAFAWLSAKSVNEKYESHKPAKLKIGSNANSATRTRASHERCSAATVSSNSGDRSAEFQLCPVLAAEPDVAGASHFRVQPKSARAIPIMAKFQGQTTKS